MLYNFIMASFAQHSFSSPELDMVMKILSQCPIPKKVDVPFEYNNTDYIISITNMGINPSAALQTLRCFGVNGIMHSTSTLHFWKVAGAPQEVCDAFSTVHQDGVFDIIEQHITKMKSAS